MQIVAVTDPLQLGFRRQAMIGLRTDGDLLAIGDTVAALPEVVYVVTTAGVSTCSARSSVRTTTTCSTC